MEEEIIKHNLSEENPVGLPPAVFPYKLTNYRDEKIPPYNEFTDAQIIWWKDKYRNIVPKSWIDNVGGWTIVNYIESHSRKTLLESRTLLEAIVAYPLTIHEFCKLAEKIPLSTELLATGFVNVLLKQPLIKKDVVENQKKLGVTRKTIKTAEKLTREWESKLQEFQVKPKVG